MTSKTDQKQREASEPSQEQKLAELHGLIEKIEIAMMITRMPSGAMAARPMSTQAKREDVDLWFMTTLESETVADLRADPTITLAYYDDSTREWVSVNGRARLVQDRSVIRERYQADWRAWLGDEGGARNGGPDDPRIVLIEVDAEHATYFKGTVPRAVAAFRVMKGIVTGEPPKVGVKRELDGGDLHRGR
ncbi:MAG: pyridoxamine 5'-phosphate oxidase family protein [Myxococcota bacterium]|nr:pyridoxamine 5'-phosphate oxidase family protein [Myxococcota bacterium]